MNCPGCDGNGREEAGLPAGDYRCESCGGLFGQCDLGDSYWLVKPFMTSENVPEDRVRYFDFDCVGNTGLTRRHGWFDTKTGLITQVG